MQTLVRLYINVRRAFSASLTNFPTVCFRSNAVVIGNGGSSRIWIHFAPSRRCFCSSLWLKVVMCHVNNVMSTVDSCSMEMKKKRTFGFKSALMFACQLRLCRSSLWFYACAEPLLLTLKNIASACDRCRCFFFFFFFLISVAFCSVPLVVALRVKHKMHAWCHRNAHTQIVGHSCAICNIAKSFSFEFTFSLVPALVRTSLEISFFCTYLFNGWHVTVQWIFSQITESNGRTERNNENYNKIQQRRAKRAGMNSAEKNYSVNQKKWVSLGGLNSNLIFCKHSQFIFLSCPPVGRFVSFHTRLHSECACIAYMRLFSWPLWLVFLSFEAQTSRKSSERKMSSACEPFNYSLDQIAAIVR